MRKIFTGLMILALASVFSIPPCAGDLSVEDVSGFFETYSGVLSATMTGETDASTLSTLVRLLAYLHENPEDRELLFQTTGKVIERIEKVKNDISQMEQEETAKWLIELENNGFYMFSYITSTNAELRQALMQILGRRYSGSLKQESLENETFAGKGVLDEEIGGRSIREWLEEKNGVTTLSHLLSYSRVTEELENAAKVTFYIKAAQLNMALDGVTSKDALKSRQAGKALIEKFKESRMLDILLLDRAILAFEWARMVSQLDSGENKNLRRDVLKGMNLNMSGYADLKSAVQRVIDGQDETQAAKVIAKIEKLRLVYSREKNEQTVEKFGNNPKSRDLTKNENRAKILALDLGKMARILENSSFYLQTSLVLSYQSTAIGYFIGRRMEETLVHDLRESTLSTDLKNEAVANPEELFLYAEELLFKGKYSEAEIFLDLYYR